MPGVAFSGALVTRSTNLSVANNAFQLVTWDTEEYDTDAYWDAGSPTRFTIPVDGYYIGGTVSRWSAAQNSAAGVRGIGIWKNGADPATQQDIGYNEWPSSGLTGALMHQTPLMPPRYFTAGDYIEATAYQFNGNSAALNLEASGGLTPAFWILRVG